MREVGSEPSEATVPAAGGGNGQVGGRRGGGGLFRLGPRKLSPYPSLMVSVARGVRADAASPAAIAAVFLATFVLWLAVVGMGAEISPKGMSNILSLSPMHTIFVDLPSAFAAFPSLPFAALAASLAMTAGRVVLFAALAALMAARMGWNEERPLRAWARAVPNLLLVSLAFYGIAAAVPLLLGGFLPGQLGGLIQLAAPLAGLYLFGFAPMAAVVDGDGYRLAVRRSIRAARLPGGSHFAICLSYFTFVFFLFAVTPSAIVAPATPSIVTWAFVLLASFLHVGVLGAFTYRWLAVRESISNEEPVRPSRSRGLGGLGLGGRGRGGLGR